MNPLSLLSSASILGGGGGSLDFGDAAPSSASSKGFDNQYITMNSPFSVAGSGGKASSSAEATTPMSGAQDGQFILVAMLVLGGILILLK